jgi:uncharacterized protein YndB with AHSA1/START domain
MTRFGVMRHLTVLEDAHLVTTERDGRRKLHYLNPMPIREIHDRWISRYAAPFADALTGLSNELNTKSTRKVTMAAARHIYESFIRATPDEVWAAITQPEFTRRYFHHTAFTTDLRPGSPHRYVLPDGTDAVDGIIEEVEQGRRLVMTWHVLYDPAMAEEPPSRVEWILRPANADGTVTRVTLRHLDLGMSPLTSDNVAVGWVGVLESMKSLLETGEGLGDLHIDPEP